MTAIAVKDGVMAADTYTLYGANDFKSNTNKIMVREGYLIATAGNACPSNEDILDWFFKAQYPLPKFEGADFNLLVLTPDKKIELWDHTGVKDKLKTRFFAIGVGAHCCMGAMEAGATAEEAVKAAIKWVHGCGGKVVSKSQ